MTERKREQKQPKYPTLVSFYRKFESGKRPLKLMRVIMTESSYSVGGEREGDKRRKMSRVTTCSCIIYPEVGSLLCCDEEIRAV